MREGFLMNLNYIKSYFNCNVEKEIERNKTNAYSRFIFNLQLDALRTYLGEGGNCILDAGCGAGSYAIEAAKMNNQIYLVDISEALIAEAIKLFSFENLNNQLIGVDILDVRHLYNIPDQYFDYVICFGGVLNFLLNDIGFGLDEFYRVLKPSGILLMSLGSKYGAIKSVLKENPKCVSFILRHKEMFDLNEILQTGSISQKVAFDIPNRQVYSAYEFSKILLEHGFNVIENRAIPSVSAGMYKLVSEIESQRGCYSELLKIEKKVATEDGLLDSGDYLFVAADKN